MRLSSLGSVWGLLPDVEGQRASNIPLTSGNMVLPTGFEPAPPA